MLVLLSSGSWASTCGNGHGGCRVGEEPQLWVDPHFLAAFTQPTTRKPKATAAGELVLWSGPGLSHPHRAHSHLQAGLASPSQQLCSDLALLLFYLLQVLTTGGSHAGSSSFLPWSA